MNKQRPEVQGFLKENMSSIERFQNTTIRPVIKMQHPLLLASFWGYTAKRKIDLTSLSNQKQRSQIASIYKKDSLFKNRVIGYIVGHFSEKEYALYALDTSEYDRRIIQIIIQRMQDTIVQLDH